MKSKPEFQRLSNKWGYTNVFTYHMSLAIDSMGEDVYKSIMERVHNGMTIDDYYDLLSLLRHYADIALRESGYLKTTGVSDAFIELALDLVDFECIVESYLEDVEVFK